MEAKKVTPSNFPSMEVLFDGGNQSFSLAVGQHEGKECIAIRWNGRTQNSFGIPIMGSYDDIPNNPPTPIWFIVPNEFKDCILKNAKSFSNANIDRISELLKP